MLLKGSAKCVYLCACVCACVYMCVFRELEEWSSVLLNRMGLPLL